MAALIGIAVLRIISTYPVFNQTYDEPLHILRGVEWWRNGSYHYPHHPPLAPIVLGIGPMLAGAEATITGDKWADGNRLLYSSSSYWRTLNLGRAGNLLFFVLACVVVWMWSRKLLGRWAGLLALAMLTIQPTVLAHASVATTDMALAATMTGLVWSFSNWIERGTIPRALLLGLTGGLALSAKFSTLVFFPACALSILAVRAVSRRELEKQAVREDANDDATNAPVILSRFRRRGVVRLFGLILSAYLTFLIVWSFYQASFGKPADAWTRQHADVVMGRDGWLRQSTDAMLARKMPAPEFVRGVLSVAHQETRGQVSYFLGRPKDRQGRWAFFPVMLLFKTPIAFLVLCSVGAGWLAGRWWKTGNWNLVVAPFSALAILCVVLPSDINIGVRHILPVYPLLVIPAAAGALALWKEASFAVFRRLLVIALFGWYVCSSLSFHPDYLAYYNELVGRDPSWMAVDSDLDWGQDLKRLSDELRMRNVDHIQLAYFGSAEVDRHALPPHQPLQPGRFASGWIAISLTKLRYENGYEWLEQYAPIALVGRSIRLYYVDRKEVEKRGREKTIR